MKGRYVCKCVVCGLEKGTGDSNSGWWMLVSRDVSPKLRTMRGMDFCPACAPALLVRSDEAQSQVGPTRWRLVPVYWLHTILATLRTAALGNLNMSPRETLGWRAAEKLAQLVGVKGLPKALPCQEFGFVPEETP